MVMQHGKAEVLDLSDFAINQYQTNGYTYQPFFAWADTSRDIKSELTVGNRPHSFNNLSLLGVVPGPARTYLMTHSDNYYNSATLHTPGSRYDWPDKTDAHGNGGVVCAFADAHVEWVSTPNFKVVRELSEDTGNTVDTPYGPFY